MPCSYEVTEPKVARVLMQVIQVSTRDIGGGADRVAWNLFHGVRDAGHTSHMVVGKKFSDDAHVIPLANESARYDRLWAGFWHAFAQRLEPWHGKIKGTWRMSRAALDIAEPVRTLDKQLGYEDFHFPAARPALDTLAPDVIHCHNLHGGYFDLRQVAPLSQRLPLVITLHDEWMLTGHCAYALGCDRWRIGCGQCPDLTIYPRVRRDGTAHNWQRKQQIYAQSRLHLSTPSQWLMDEAQASMLAGGMVEARVIPYGVDLEIFRPADQAQARQLLDLPADALILLFSGARFRSNPFKDYDTIRQAIRHLAPRLDANQRVVFIALGDVSPPEQLSDTVRIQAVPYQTELARIAAFYQASDVYLHAAKADNFPNAILEALACGLPVIATGVGGIPEQVTAGETGLVTPPQDAEAMAQAILALVNDPAKRQQFSQAAVDDARQRFDLHVQIKTHLEWYQELIHARLSR